jgi:hypothetical protein
MGMVALQGSYIDLLIRNRSGTLVLPATEVTYSVYNVQRKAYQHAFELVLSVLRPLS